MIQHQNLYEHNKQTLQRINKIEIEDIRNMTYLSKTRELILSDEELSELVGIQMKNILSAPLTKEEVEQYMKDQMKLAGESSDYKIPISNGRTIMLYETAKLDRILKNETCVEMRLFPDPSTIGMKHNWNRIAKIKKEYTWEFVKVHKHNKQGALITNPIKITDYDHLPQVLFSYSPEEWKFVNHETLSKYTDLKDESTTLWSDMNKLLEHIACQILKPSDTQNKERWKDNVNVIDFRHYAEVLREYKEDLEFLKLDPSMTLMNGLTKEVLEERITKITNKLIKLSNSIYELIIQEPIGIYVINE